MRNRRLVKKFNRTKRNKKKTIEFDDHDCDSEKKISCEHNKFLNSFYDSPSNHNQKNFINHRKLDSNTNRSP